MKISVKNINGIRPAAWVAAKIEQMLRGPNDIEAITAYYGCKIDSKTGAMSEKKLAFVGFMIDGYGELILPVTGACPGEHLHFGHEVADDWRKRFNALVASESF